MKTFLPLMTPSEVSDAIARNAPVFLPIGTVEVNGHHLPLGYDYLMADALAKRVASALSGVALPPITFGVSGPLDAFPGTVAVPPTVLEQQTLGILRSLVHQGFRTIVVLNNHIPNQSPVEQAVRTVRRESGVLAPVIVPSKVAQDIARELWPDITPSLGHGGEPGTSLMLSLYPDDVRMDIAEQESLGTYRGFKACSPLEVEFQNSRVSMFLDIGDVSVQGGWGNPEAGSAERGAELLQHLEDFVCNFVSAYQAAG
jgi:creatinine amidohydrolase